MCLRVKFWYSFKLNFVYPVAIKIELVARMMQRLSKRHLTRKTKGIVVFAIVAFLLFSFFALSVPVATWFKEKNGGAESGDLIVSGQPVNNAVWKQVAANAWAYFKPGVGVDANTGLPYAGGAYFKAFTDWDLGVYIQAVINAQEIGLINTNGAWGSYARLDKILSYLENRPINETTHYPFWFYDSTNGKDYKSLSDKATEPVDIVDTGRLFVALNNLKMYNPSWTQRIDNFVYNIYDNRSDYAALVPNLEGDMNSNSIYAYYFDSGYASFWPQQLGNIPTSVINNISKSPTLTTYGNISLPKVPLACDPMLCSIFEVNSTNFELNAVANQVFLAHEAYYNDTGQYVAYSEGNGFSGQYLWEWVVGPDSVTPWQITASGGVFTGNAIIYTKVAFSFLALYNATYAQNTIVYLEKELPNPTNGYSDGINTAGRVVPGVGSNTNGMILDAALYAIQNGSKNKP